MPSRGVKILRFIVVLFGAFLCISGTGNVFLGGNMAFGVLSFIIGLPINYWFFVFLPKSDNRAIKEGRINSFSGK